MPGAPVAIEVSESYQQIVWWVYVVDQQTMAALSANLQDEQPDDRYTPKPKLYARKPEETQLPASLQKKSKYPKFKSTGSLQSWHTQPHMNRRAHQDNTRVR